MRPSSQTARASIGVATAATVDSRKSPSHVAAMETDARTSRTANATASPTRRAHAPNSLRSMPETIAARLPADQRTAPVYAGPEREEHAEIAVFQLARPHLLVDEDRQRPRAGVAEPIDVRGELRLGHLELLADVVVDPGVCLV